MIINRRDCLLGTLSAAVALPAVRAAAQSSQVVATPSVTSVDPAKYPRAWEVQRSTLVVNGLDPSQLNEKYLDMLKAGGVDCWHHSMGGWSSFARMLAFCDANEARIVPVGTVREIREAKRQGKIGHVSGWQSAKPLIDDADGQPAIGNLRGYKALGLRIAGIAYNYSNLFGGGCLDHEVPLTRLGRKYVEEIHKLRIVLDVCAHTAERTSMDAVQMSSGVPVICSHTNVGSIARNPRNISDRMIDAIAKTGGVIGLTAVSDLHTRNGATADTPASPHATLAQHLDQYDYLKKRVGVDHIGMGPDFMTGTTSLGGSGGRDADQWPLDVYGPWPWNWVKDFETIVELPKVTQGLLDRGWSEAEVRKVLGENWLRVYEKVWGA